MREPRLEVQVDAQAPLLARIRKRLAFALGVLVGMTAVAGAIGLGTRGEVATERIIYVEAEAAAPTPQPEPEPAPPPPAPVADDPLRCPVIEGEDRRIGKAVHRMAVQDTGDDVLRRSEVEVVAAARAPVIAYLERSAGTVMVSDDDGRAFSRVFHDPEDHRDLEAIAIDAAGVLYALSPPELGVREPGKRERWYAGPFGDCTTGDCVDHLALAGDRVVWIRDNTIATSTNHGRTWRIAIADSIWEPVYNGAPSTVFSWHGAVYRVDHYWDRCGIDDYPTWRFDGKTLDHFIFHLHYDNGDSALVASDDAATTWTWRRRCRDDDYAFTRPCPAARPRERAMLEAYTLLPAEGARSLAVFEGGLVELCPGGARLVHRRYPFRRVDAVDSVGRPLQVRDDAVYRWSPIHGWRRLSPEPPVAAGEE
jgi:hypothetical protein